MIYLNVGRRRVGKTTLGLFVAKRSDRAIVFDPRHQFGVVPREQVIGGLPDDYATLCAEWEAGSSLLVVQPGAQLNSSVECLAGFTAEKLDDDPQLKLAVLLDEIALYDEQLSESWDVLFRTCPHERLIVILTTHRPKDIPTDVRALADTWCIFRTTQEHDLKVIDERCGRHVRDLVERLEPRQFVAWDDGESKTTLYRDPSVWRCEFGQKATAIGPTSQLPAGEVPPSRKGPALF